VTPDIEHTQWSAPGALQATLRELIRAPEELPEILTNFITIYGSARARGIEVPLTSEEDRNLRSTKNLLRVATQRDQRPFCNPRATADYIFGTCRDFGLLAVSALRESGIPARLRVGFANYLRPGHWEDHWVCEYWGPRGWMILDASLGARMRAARGILWQAANVPRENWQSAAQIWREVKADSLDPALCGICFAGLSGAWFIARSMMQDAAALAGIETLPWDNWGPALRMGRTRQVSAAQGRDLDALALALDPPPLCRTEAQNVLTRFPWANPTPTIISFPAHNDRREIVLSET
jgi:hypothetical protein